MIALIWNDVFCWRQIFKNLLIPFLSYGLLHSIAVCKYVFDYTLYEERNGEIKVPIKRYWAAYAIAEPFL